MPDEAHANSHNHWFHFRYLHQFLLLLKPQGPLLDILFHHALSILKLNGVLTVLPRSDVLKKRCYRDFTLIIK